MQILKSIIFIIFVFLSGFSLLYADTSFPLLEKLISQEKYEKAYQLAIKLRDKNEGDPRFDYLYGLSALQTAHYDEAVFALDRVTVTSPRVIRPRLELARAYLKLNNKRAAIKAFNDVLSLSPPPVVRQKVMAYISTLNKQNKMVKKSVTQRLASFAVGYDDNINFGYRNSDINLPLFGLVTLNPSAVKQASGFAETKFHIAHRKIHNKKRNSFVSANLTHRKYFESTNYSFIDLGFRAGTTLNHDKKQFQFVASYRPVLLNGKLHSNTVGIDAIVRKNITNGNTVSMALAVDDYDNKRLPLTNRKRAVLGVSWNKNSGELQHQINASYGSEWPDEKAGKQFSRDILGLGYKLAHDWNAKHTSFINFDYRNYKHKEANPLFPDKRIDNQYIVNAVHEWQVSDKAAILFSARHIDNNSNLELYDAKRNELQVGIRYEWD